MGFEPMNTGMRKFLLLLLMTGAAMAQMQTSTGNLTPLSTNAVYYASMYQASDVGAQINLADTAAGSGPADIIVTLAGTVTTVPTIRSNHRLILAAPLSWGNVSLVLNSNTQVIGTGSNAVQAVKNNGFWISATGLTNIEIDNVWMTNDPTATSGEATAMFSCSACTKIVMNHNHAVNLGVLRTYSSETTYALVNSSNITRNVHMEGNYMDGTGSFNVLAYLGYVQHATLIGNDAYNAEYNVEWWGGNSAVEGLTLSNTRWVQDININGGVAVSTVAAYWGSMGQNIVVSGVNADGCQDVCLDAESSTNVVFSGFTVHNSTNGGLATFFASLNVEFGPGIVTSDTAVSGMMFAHNAGADPTRSYGVKIHHVKFVCLDPAALCRLVADPIGGFQFNDNEVDNAALTFIGTNSSGYEVSGNKFSYTFVPSAFSAVSIPGQVANYKPNSIIAGNTFQSAATQPAGTYAINATITDPNFPDILYVRDNTTQGFTNDAHFIANSANTGVSPTFVFSGNSWGAYSVKNTIAGALGKFIGNNYNPATDSTIFTGGVGSGHLINGVGLQMVSVAACTPGSALMAQCTSTITLPVPEPNPAYVVVCNALGTNVIVGSTKNYTRTTFQVDIYATATFSVSVTGISCLVTHP